LAPIALKAVKSVINIETSNNVDLNDIKIYKKLGGTMDDIQLYRGLIFPHTHPVSAPGAPNKILAPKVALL
jgi:T-complex protein 1 subunit delta